MKRFILPCFVSLIFAGCSTDFDLIENYKETTVVFGLLDQNDTAHYIRVNKAFLGEGNALVMAQQFDSINYSNQLTVSMEEIKNTGTRVTESLYKDTSIPKEPGIFSYPGNVLYKSNASLNSTSVYKLNIINNSTKNIVTAETPLIDGFDITLPKSTTTTFDFVGSNPETTINMVKRVEWRSARNGRLYSFVLRFHYTEVDKATNVKTYKYTDWFFAEQKSLALSGGENMSISFKGRDFYTFLGDAIPPSNGKVWRYPRTLEFRFSVASEEFNTYMEVNAPSTGIVQEKPQYTNITNGVGIFASRLRDNSRKNIKITGNSLLELYKGSQTGQTTINLGFCDSVAGSPNACK